MNITVGVIGSSMVYFKDGFWNVVFISDTCHVVNLAGPHTGGVYRPFARPQYHRNVLFRANGATPATGWDPAERDKFLNLSASYLHGSASGSESNLEEFPDPRYGHQRVHLKIPFGTVRAANSYGSEYYYQRVGTYSRIPMGKSMPNAFGISFVVPDGVPLTLAISDSTSPNPIVIPADSGNVTLTFNNYCDICKGYNDFIHHDEWIRDRRSIGSSNPIQFVAGELDDICNFAGEPTKANIESFEKQLAEAYLQTAAQLFSYDLKRFGPDGDCDPVGIEPPPGP